MHVRDKSQMGPGPELRSVDSREPGRHLYILHDSEGKADLLQADAEGTVSDHAVVSQVYEDRTIQCI